eukprot:jgi/Mesen1/6611/ME000034S06062
MLCPSVSYVAAPYLPPLHRCTCIALEQSVTGGARARGSVGSPSEMTTAVATERSTPVRAGLGGRAGGRRHASSALRGGPAAAAAGSSAGSAGGRPGRGRWPGFHGAAEREVCRRVCRGRGIVPSNLHHGRGPPRRGHPGALHHKRASARRKRVPF